MKQKTKNASNPLIGFFFIGETKFPNSQFQEAIAAFFSSKPLPASNATQDNAKKN